MLKRFAQKIRESQNKILLGIFGAVTVSGLAFLAYRAYTRHSHKSHIQSGSQIEVQEGNQAENGPKLKPANEQLTKSLIRVVENVKQAVKNSQDFAFEAVKAIYEGYHEHSFPQFKRLALESRRIRRQNIGNLLKYKEILLQYEKQIQAARNKSLVAILEFFKLQLREWYVLVEKYSEQCKEQWEQIVILTDVKQLNALRPVSTSPLDPEIMIQIFEYKQQIFEEVLNAAGNMFPDRNSNQLYSFVDRRLSDLVFMKFGTEDEDVFFSMVVISPTTKKKIEQLEQRINARLQFFVSGPHD